ncbi:hypothetical protein SUDANB15_07552 (plasmid) [Streptomyces sp. enrichment culture]
MHRPAVFAALLGLTRAGSTIGDYWVSTAKPLSAFRGVSLLGEIHSWCSRRRVAGLSRLA